jgi:pantoate--beta-alanine ligase
MRVCITPNDMRAARAEMRGSTGFVPTMGALHDGHLALVYRAHEETDHVILSIFVNPTQFASNAEVDRYPRTLDRDLTLAEANGVAVVFMPTADDLYPAGFSTFIDAGEVTKPLEGATRPGHFQGVATVVTKLLNIVQPDRAYFGQKDAQQLIVVRRVIRDLDIPVEIVGVPTVRDPAGIAISSRNMLLAPEELQAARCLSRALGETITCWQCGERDADSLREAMKVVIRDEPRATLDYVSIADPATLGECNGRVAGPVIASLAVYVGGVRLIDNACLSADSMPV